MDSSNYCIGSVPVLETDATPPTDPGARYEGLNPRTRVLPVGYKREPDCRAWETETVFEQDIPICLRDGIIIRADVFRPANTSTVPAIVHYSPYGKSGTG
jgi:predicted acyl esterase